jgi:DNA topoisomerase-3
LHNNKKRRTTNATCYRGKTERGAEYRRRTVLGADKKRSDYTEGGGYLVSWCVGHLIGFADAAAYDERYSKWPREDLPILPDEWKYTVSSDRRKQFHILRELMSRPDVESLVCATDAGHEGELIFRFVYQMSGCKKSFSRLWIR